MKIRNILNEDNKKVIRIGPGEIIFKSNSKGIVKFQINYRGNMGTTLDMVYPIIDRVTGTKKFVEKLRKYVKNLVEYGGPDYEWYIKGEISSEIWNKLVKSENAKV